AADVSARRISTHAHPGGVVLLSGQAPEAVSQPSAARTWANLRTSVVLPAPGSPLTSVTVNRAVLAAAAVSLLSSASRPTNGSESSGGGSGNASVGRG